MRQLEKDISIGASPAAVWATLTDLAAYPAWNPFIRSASGAPKPGSRLTIRIQPSGARETTFRASVLAVVPTQFLSWLGHLDIPGLFDGEHHFISEPTGAGRVRFTQREVFRGLLAPLILHFIGEA